MNKDLIKKLYKDYNKKIDSIIEKYGEKDGFIIEGEMWWDYYKNLINEIFNKIEKDELKEADAINFYKKFGFGPKLYGKSFIENGLEKIEKLFTFLKDENITPEQKIKEVVEDPDSENFIKGVGLNFVTLFLTVCFPKKYAQWTTQIDEALKILGVFPKKLRGERKSQFYLKLNKVCLEIGNILDIEFLPKVDNFLYCLSKGYIGAEKQIEKKIEEETKKKEEIEEKELKKDIEVTIHTEMMYYLIKIGLNKNYDVWVAINDRNKDYNGIKFSEICLNEIPAFTQPSTIVVAKYIDVIWFKKNTSNPIRFFEVEHSTSIYSGLLRLNDVRIDFPFSKATIIIPKNRIDLFETQIERRSFKHSGLYDICDYLTYEDLKKWYEAENIIIKYK